MDEGEDLLRQTQPAWDGGRVRLSDVHGALAICDRQGALLDLTAPARSLLARAGFTPPALPWPLPPSLWREALAAPAGVAGAWRTPADVCVSCTRYGVGASYTMLILEEVADPSGLLGRLHRQRLEATGRAAVALAHGLRLPLDTLCERARSLDGPARDGLGDDARVALRDISASAARLLDTVDAVLAYNRPEGEGAGSAALADVVAAAALAVRPVMLAQGNALTVEHDGAIGRVRGGPLALTQVFVNLLLNAFEAGGAGAEVRVATERREGPDGLVAYARVSDDGPGVLPALGPRLFEPFFTTKPGRSGLGLTLAREAAVAAGGDVRLEPSARGACFAVLLRPDDGGGR
ncbi:MAG: HAMP domain-containing histidine kinase [Polyangiaceae bacterium]|jgi:signal transduction histidine kinase|nr:HAMP domain-containing histidine kinase [Polyangiaceae bacterium]